MQPRGLSPSPSSIHDRPTFASPRLMRFPARSGIPPPRDPGPPGVLFFWRVAPRTTRPRRGSVAAVRRRVDCPFLLHTGGRA